MTGVPGARVFRVLGWDVARSRRCRRSSRPHPAFSRLLLQTKHFFHSTLAPRLGGPWATLGPPLGHPNPDPIPIPSSNPNCGAQAPSPARIRVFVFDHQTTQNSIPAAPLSDNGDSARSRRFRRSMGAPCAPTTSLLMADRSQPQNANTRP